MSENLLQTEDKYSAVYFEFAPNRWHVTDDEKSCVLSVNGEYNYSKLLELYNAIEVDRARSDCLGCYRQKRICFIGRRTSSN